MKKQIFLFFINLVSLEIASRIFLGIRYNGGFLTLVSAAVALTAVNLLIKPLISILLLPINLLTLGSLRWLIQTLTLYLVTIFVPQFQISGFKFLGFNYQGFIIPNMFLNRFLVLILSSLLINLISSFSLWLVE